MLTWDNDAAINTDSETIARLEFSYLDGPVVYTFKVTNEPVCDSYTSSMLSFEAKITDKNS